jgi:hypothetical protein
MTLDELVRKLDSLGFFCVVQHFPEEGDSRLFVTKLRATSGNRIAGAESTFVTEDGASIQLDEPTPIVWFRPEGIEFKVVAGVPSSPGAYMKDFATADEVYEELLHYFFDPDSRMRLEPGFEAGPGRPSSA